MIISRQTPSACSKGVSQPQSPVSKWKAHRSQLKDPETPVGQAVQRSGEPMSLESDWAAMAKTLGGAEVDFMCCAAE